MGSNRQVFTPPATQTRDKCRTVAHYGSDNLVLRSLFWKKHNFYYFDSANESNYWTSGYLTTWTSSSWQYLISTTALFGVPCSGRHHQYQEESYLTISSYTSQSRNSHHIPLISTSGKTSDFLLDTNPVPLIHSMETILLPTADLSGFCPFLQQPDNTLLLKLLLYYELIASKALHSHVPPTLERLTTYFSPPSWVARRWNEIWDKILYPPSSEAWACFAPIFSSCGWPFLWKKGSLSSWPIPPTWYYLWVV